LQKAEAVDYNTVTAVRLRQAKRELAELEEARLAVREERERVGEKMDAVRKKHEEREAAARVRSLDFGVMKRMLTCGRSISS
jgi:hypothetical protein